MSARDIPPELLSDIWPHLAVDLRASIRRAVAKGLEALKTPEPLNLNQWAERHFYLSAESSQGEKRWSSYPFQRALLAMMGDDDIEEIDIRKSARVGYTKMLLASIGYDAHHKRRNQCLWQPTDGDSDEFCKAELEPMLRDVRAMAAVFPKFMAKSKSNTLNMKKFLGSLLYLKGGTSAGNFRRMTLQSAKIDEFDGFDQKIEKSADPFTLAWKRLEGATYPKMICGTTPRIKGLSHIEKREAAAVARMQFHISCPHCGGEHPLIWGGEKLAHGFKWDKLDPEGTIHHVCPHCRGSITQADYLRVWEQGVWVSACGNYRCYYVQNLGVQGQPDPYFWTDNAGNRLTRPPRHVACHVWTAYSPQTTWVAIVRQFLECVRSKKAGDKAPLEGFINETLGETWEDDYEQADTHALQARAEDYPLRRVPVGGLALVAGVDQQSDRWEVTVWALGRGGERWAVDYQVIYGNLALLADWESKLHTYLQNPLTHWHGAPMKIAGTAIDTGGHFTHIAYDFCRLHVGDNYYAVKGDSLDGKPIKGKSSLQDVNSKGRIIKRGVRLWMVGTDTAKDLFFGLLKVDKPGPGYVHFSKHLPALWFKGLTSEVRKAVKTSKGVTHRWVQVVDRNEPLDTTIYSMFSELMNFGKYLESDWRRLENNLLPDLFDAPDPVPLPVPTPAPDPAAEKPLLPGQIEVREVRYPAKDTPAPAPVAAAPVLPPQLKRKAPAPSAPANPAAPLVSPFASAEWSSRL